MADLFIGTSGYDYPEWRGVFYPSDLRRKDYLAYYASVFNAVELNVTFYRMPTKCQMMSLIERSGGRLHFAVKANRMLTHEISRDYISAASEFIEAVRPVRERGLLASILFQMPQSFRYTPDNRLYLDRLLRLFGGYPLAVEFRHREWIRQSVLSELSERQVTPVCCDMPDLRDLPQTDWTDDKLFMDAQAAYLRLHGRNSRAWYASDRSGSISPRYQYEYSEDELSVFAGVVGKIRRFCRNVLVFFNNHPCGYGAANATNLKKMLGNQEIKYFDRQS